MDKAHQFVNYEYQVLRYRPDAVSGEFVNVGIIYFDASTRFLKAGMLDKYKRISQFFTDVPGTFMMRSLKRLKNQVTKINQQLQSELDFEKYQSVNDVTAALLPKDDNGFFFSETFKGLHFEHEVSFKELYQRIVEQYVEVSIERQDDAYAWKNIYKSFFDKYKLTDQLVSHSVHTANDEIEFDKTIQNGALHCFQSITFDLKNETDIKDKVYKWDGKVHELQTTEQPLKLYLLSVLPENQQLVQLIQHKLNVSTPNVEVQVVQEKDAEQVVRSVKAAMEAH